VTFTTAHSTRKSSLAFYQHVESRWFYISKFRPTYLSFLIFRVSSFLLQVCVCVCFFFFFFFFYSSHVFRLKQLSRVLRGFFLLACPRGKADLKGFTRLHKRESHCRHPQRQWRQQSISRPGRVPSAWVLVLPSTFFVEGGGGGVDLRLFCRLQCVHAYKEMQFCSQM
jgi:hypothetical protein